MQGMRTEGNHALEANTMVEKAVKARVFLRHSGNSFAVYLPPLLIENLEWKTSEPLYAYIQDGKLILERT